MPGATANTPGSNQGADGSSCWTGTLLPPLSAQHDASLLPVPAPARPGLAELVLEHLAAGRPGQVADNLDVPGHGEVREHFYTEAGESLGLERRARADRDDRLDLVFQQLAGDAHDGGLKDVGVPGDGRLY